jgi:hypothetical protein
VFVVEVLVNVEPSGFVYVNVTVTSETGRLMVPEILIKLPKGTLDVMTGEPPAGTANKETEHVIELGAIVSWMVIECEVAFTYPSLSVTVRVIL